MRLSFEFQHALTINSHVSLATKEITIQTKHSVDRVHEYHDDQKRDEMLNWLSLNTYAAQQSDLCNQREEGTGKWLLSTSEFQQWVDGREQTLFCPGIPGAGKTTIVSAVADHLHQRYYNVAYIYCNFRHQQQSVLDLLACILRQLVQCQPLMPEICQELYERHKDRGSRPSLDEIKRVLHTVTADLHKSFVVIDALDECSSHVGSRLLSEVFNLQAKHGVNILVTSRYLPEITSQFEGQPCVEIRAKVQDIEQYLRRQFTRLPAFVARNTALQDEIVAGITNAVGGM